MLTLIWRPSSHLGMFKEHPVPLLASGKGARGGLARRDDVAAIPGTGSGKMETLSCPSSSASARGIPHLGPTPVASTAWWTNAGDASCLCGMPKLVGSARSVPSCH